MRFEAFLEAYNPKVTNPLLYIKSLNGMSICLCSNILKQKTLRTRLGSIIWCNSADPPNMLPENFGYQLENGKY